MLGPITKALGVFDTAKILLKESICCGLGVSLKVVRVAYGRKQTGCWSVMRVSFCGARVNKPHEEAR